LNSKEESFYSLYKTKLEPIVHELNKKSHDIRINKILFFIIIPACFLIFCGIIAALPDWLIFFFFIFFLMSVSYLYTIMIQDPSQNHQKDVKRKVISPLVKLINKSFVYKATVSKKSQRSILKEFRKSEIFSHKNPWNGSSFKKFPPIPGYSGKEMEFQVGQYIYSTADTNKLEISTIQCDIDWTDEGWQEMIYERFSFNGLFISIDFNKNFNGKTFILPEEILGYLNEDLQSLLTRSGQELIRLEDAKFEKKFIVYSDDQIEARYILSPSLMERILDFRNSTNKLIKISFVKNKLYMTIQNTDSTVPGIYTLSKKSRNLVSFRNLNTVFSSHNIRPIVFNDIREYYNNLTLVLDLSERLKLNRRIWRKDSV